VPNPDIISINLLKSPARAPDEAFIAPRARSLHRPSLQSDKVEYCHAMCFADDGSLQEKIKEKIYRCTVK